MRWTLLAAGARKGEHAMRSFNKRSLEYFHQLMAQCVAQDVSRMVICDTNGGAGPEEVDAGDRRLRRTIPSAKFGFHGHTDRGLGVANTRAAILAGAVQVQGTLLGTGERCGNVNLTTVIGGMQLRGEAEFVSAERLRGLTSLAHRRMRRSAWKRRTARQSLARARLEHGPECTAAASARIPARICGAIRRGLGRVR